MKGVIRFIVYNWRGQLTIIERTVPALSQRFDPCIHYDECKYSDLDAVICSEENDIIRQAVCPEFKMRASNPVR